MAIGDRRGTRRVLGTGAAGLFLIFGVLTGLTATATPAGAEITQVVTNCNDSGPGSLRQAVLDASPGDAIIFSSLSCSMITLASTIDVTTSMSIYGPGASALAVSGNGSVQDFNVAFGITVSISGLTIEGGNALDGGGINDDGTLNVVNSTLSDNSAVGADAEGGGIFIEGGAVTVTDSTFTGNSAEEGAAIWDDGNPVSGSVLGSLTITNSTLSDNNASGAGGAVETVEGVVTIEASTLSGNTATVSGGAINSEGGTVTIEDSTLSGNSATADGGGGVYNFGGSLVVNSSTLASNSAGYGGTIANYGSAATQDMIANSTLANNTAATAGDGGGVNNGTGATVTTLATIIANNGSGLDCTGTVTDLGFNLDDDGSCGFTASTSVSDMPADLDPSGLQNNGGPTQTVALETGSPAIGAVTNSADCPVIDQRGYVVSTPCDIGAYDSTAVAPSPTAPGVPQDASWQINTARQLTLTWLPPANNGGSAITSYVVSLTRRPKPMVVTTGGCVVCSATVSNVVGPWGYTVAAVNALGTGSTTPISTAYPYGTAMVKVTRPKHQPVVLGAGPFSLQVNASTNTGTSLTYSASNLPSGLSINSSTGLISGTITNTATRNTPLYPGTTVTVTDGIGTVGTISFGWLLIVPIRIAAISHQSTVVNTGPITLPVEATDLNATTLSYAASGLPTGLSINSTTGIITGTPTTAGPNRVYVTVTDAGGQSSTISWSWTVTRH